MRRWHCINCGHLGKGEVTEEFYGDQSFTYCNRCDGKVTYDPLIIVLPKPTRPKRFCFFIRPKDSDIQKPFEKYTRREEFFLAIRVGYFREAWRLLRGKPSNYIWEGLENNPMPF